MVKLSESILTTMDYRLASVGRQEVLSCLAAIPEGKKAVDLVKPNTIIASNNTPPASRKISAPRGVTFFRATQKVVPHRK